MPGKIRANTPVCPDASPLQCPDPEQLFPKTPIFKRRCCCSEFELHPRPEQLCAIPKSRSCNPESRWYNNPNNLSTYPRSPNWQPQSPIPNPEYPEHFPLGGRMPDPAKKSSYSAGLSLSAVTGICSASMGISAGVTSFMRFLARSINSCSCSTI